MSDDDTTTCPGCGRALGMPRGGRCMPCRVHPPGTKWKGGPTPLGTELWVMPSIEDPPTHEEYILVSRDGSPYSRALTDEATAHKVAKQSGMRLRVQRYAFVGEYDVADYTDGES